MIAAAALGLLVGLVVGGLGGGGGVLTVPALVYLLGQTAQDATTGSIVIVGITAVAGTLTRLRGGIDWRTGLIFGVLGIPAAYLGTHLNQHVAPPVLLLAFAATTLLAATAMLLDTRRCDEPEPRSAPTATTGTSVLTALPARHRLRTAVTVAGWALAIGFLTGFLGVGGGFLVVPALVIALRMPITRAVGTSLLIIALNAVSSLVPRLDTAMFDWQVIIPFTVAAVLGSIAAKPLADRLSGTTLARAFAVLLIAVGAFVAVESVLAL
jgi:uncharacterized membrane protein YfcA